MGRGILPRRSAASSLLVRHQHRSGHRLENAPCHATEHKFAQPRVAVAAHDDEIGASIGGVREDHVGDIDVAKHRALDLNFEPVPRKVLRHIGAFDFILLAAFVADNDDFDLAGFLE